ncbi:hypothetical protein ABT282_08275 [Streptomyces sp. NPDC000927]|uniref:hypothetical protein n=1 Tax=Streptomyces sp. NPDC000927 TaxID=3154371 RepID=UPI003332F6F0
MSKIIGGATSQIVIDTETPINTPTGTPLRSRLMPKHYLRTSSKALQEFNRATHHPTPGWDYPADSCTAIGRLAQISRMLPQAIEQSIHPAQRVHEHGKLLIDNGGDPDQQMTNFLTSMEEAVAAAEALNSALETMHSISARMILDIS